MTTFNEGLSNLKTANEFNSWLTHTVSYQNSQEYQDKIQQKENDDAQFYLHHIVQIIKTHFNDDNISSFDAEICDISIFVGLLTSTQITELIQSLDSKGYITTLDNGTTILTISANGN